MIHVCLEDENSSRLTAELPKLYRETHRDPRETDHIDQILLDEMKPTSKIAIVAAPETAPSLLAALAVGSKRIGRHATMLPSQNLCHLLRNRKYRDLQ